MIDVICVFVLFYFSGICYAIEQTGDNGAVNRQSNFKFTTKYRLSDSYISHVPKQNLQQLDTKWRHLVDMGNSIGLSKDESLVFGAPYAWIGDSWYSKFSKERRPGTIAKFNIEQSTNSSGKTEKILVPNPKEKNGFGASWVYNPYQRYASKGDPRRHDMTGVSFVKGSFIYSLKIKSWSH